LSVNLFDRVLDKRSICKSELKLIAVTALFIGSKFEEPTQITSKEILGFASFIFTKEELITSEARILLDLDFKLNYTSPWKFFESYYY
jgi:hypothetical protein